MSSRKAKKDGQEERNGIWNGPDEDSPIKPTAAGAPFNIKQEVQTMKLGDQVRTPRFCTVKIGAMFTDETEARKCGYTEPTYYQDGEYTVLGKSLDMYSMIFCAVPVQ